MRGSRSPKFVSFLSPTQFVEPSLHLLRTDEKSIRPERKKINATHRVKPCSPLISGQMPMPGIVATSCRKIEQKQEVKSRLVRTNKNYTKLRLASPTDIVRLRHPAAAERRGAEETAERLWNERIRRDRGTGETPDGRFGKHNRNKTPPHLKFPLAADKLPGSPRSAHGLAGALRAQ
jgi:hypothetical protein